MPQQVKARFASPKEVQECMENAVGWTRRAQNDENYWVARLESNSSMEAEWLLAYHILGIEHDPKTESVIECLLNMQRKDGSWGVYHGAEAGDLNATVEAYAALRVHGHAATSDHMERARAYILEHGGIAKTRGFTKIWLAMCGPLPPLVSF